MWTIYFQRYLIVTRTKCFSRSYPEASHQNQQRSQKVLSHQNQRKMKTFSVATLVARTQRKVLVWRWWEMKRSSWTWFEFGLMMLSMMILMMMLPMQDIQRKNDRYDTSTSPPVPNWRQVHPVVWGRKKSCLSLYWSWSLTKLRNIKKQLLIVQFG